MKLLDRITQLLVAFNAKLETRLKKRQVLLDNMHKALDFDEFAEYFNQFFAV